MEECKCNNTDEEMTTEDLIEENNFVLNNLVDLLIEKKIISEKEFIKKLNDSAEKEQED